MTTKTNTRRLAARTWAAGVHGITGAPVDEGWLEAGTLVRGIEPTGAVHPLDGQPWYRLDASTDGGATWYTHEVCGEPRTA